MPKKTTALASTEKKNPYEGHAYLNLDGSVDGKRLLEVVQNTPGAFYLIMANAALEKRGVGGFRLSFGPNNPPEQDLGHMVEGLINLIMIASFGDEVSASQLKAIEKLMKPAKYELPLTKIREIIDRYETSPRLARGWELRRIMSNLCWVVEPLKTTPPYSPDQPIKMTPNPRATFVGLADLARPHVKRNSTLQSVAISLYLEQLQKQGITDEGSTITEKSLKADLARVREWERTASEEDKQRRGHWSGLGLSGGDAITWCDFSEGWKKRKQARRSSSKGAMKKKLLKS